MAKEPSTTNGATKTAKSAVKRQNKPRSFYMVYKGNLEAPPKFAFDRDELIETMLNDRDVKVEKITLPQGRGRGKKGSDTGAATDTNAPAPSAPSA